MDSDMQHLPEEIPLLVDKLKEGYEFVSGRRVKRKESLFFRRIPSLIANYFLRKVTQCPVKDMGGFKCMDGEIARQLQLRAGQHRFLPALVWNWGGRIAEVDISAPPRTTGVSHYGISRMFDVMFDVMLFWLQMSCKSRPIYLFGRMSFMVAMLSTLIMGWVLYEKIALGIHMGNRPPFFISLSGYFVSGGLISIGFILEIISDIQNKVSNTKPYMIRSKIN